MRSKEKDAKEEKEEEEEEEEELAVCSAPSLAPSLVTTVVPSRHAFNLCGPFNLSSLLSAVSQAPLKGPLHMI